MKQEQQLKQSQQDTLRQELKQRLTQDFLNIIRIIADVQATIKYFNNKPNNEIVAVQKNKLITQYNLSNSINVCDNQEAQESNNKNFLLKEKNKIKQILQSFKQKNNLDQWILEILQEYETINLNQNPFIKNKQLITIQKKYEFNQQTFQKVIEGMNYQDQIQQEIMNGKQIDDITNNQVQTQYDCRIENAFNKLQSNFGTQVTIQKQEKENYQRENIKISKQEKNNEKNIQKGRENACYCLIQ